MADKYPTSQDEAKLAKEALATDSFAPVSLAVAQAARERIADPEALYLSLVRALRRRKGFGIVFLQCTPAKGQELLVQLQKDLPRKNIGNLKLKEPIADLLTLMAEKEDIAALDVLFIEGIDQSLAPYIKSEVGRSDYYKLEVLPPILDHLNRKRENFREQFSHLCLVFVVPPFALKYFMNRAVDFFDWRSGIWTFAPEKEQLAQETTKALAGIYHEYLALSKEERTEKNVALQNLIEIKDQTDEQRSQLYAEQSLVFNAAQDFEVALRCCEEAIVLDCKNENAWFCKGLALSALGRNEEEIAAYDAALSIKPDDYEALYNKGVCLSALGRKEEAVAAYDAALSIAPDKHAALYNKGGCLSDLGRNKEAIAAYDEALSLKPDYHEALHNKGLALSALGRNEEAIAAYDEALSLKPGLHEALYGKGNALSALGRNEEAIAACDVALTLKPDSYEAFVNKALALYGLDRNEEALIACDVALTLNSDSYAVLVLKAAVLYRLRRNEEALIVCDAVLALNPDNATAWYNKACYHALSHQLEDALTSLQKALELDDTDEHIELAKTDTNFDSIRKHPQFRALMAEYSSLST